MEEKMKNSMVIQSADGKFKTHHICPSNWCVDFNQDAAIETFYSPVHAMDKGWRWTDNIRFCQPIYRRSGFVQIVGIMLVHIFLRINKMQELINKLVELAAEIGKAQVILEQKDAYIKRLEERLQPPTPPAAVQD